MAAEFLKAKNGSDCAKANNIFLHSAYNPEQEAERFSQNVAADFIPQTIIVIEGALGYAAAALKKRFPFAQIGTIRLCEDFAAYDKAWDFVLPDFSSEKIFNLLGEEGLFQTIFLEWPPSTRAFAEKTKIAWQEIKAAMEKAKMVLATREYFGKKWLKNKINFFCRIKNTALLERIKKPVVICASGPSLAAALPLIKNMRERIFLVALSSAISVLRHNKITPDLCFSSDGGYWAKKHLDALCNNLQTTLALATEGECHAEIFHSATIVPLCYDDDELSKNLFKVFDIKYMNARRNGTVSGTALEFFLEASDGDIFFAGLDLASGTTFAHAQPNALENEAAQRDFRLCPKASRVANSAFPSPSLKMYAEWFKNYSWNIKKNVFRICGEEAFKNDLGKIKDISILETEKIIKSNSHFSESNSAQFFEVKKIRLEQIRDIITKAAATSEWQQEMFPADSILYNRAADIQEKKKRQDAITRKTKTLLQEIFGK